MNPHNCVGEALQEARRRLLAAGITAYALEARLLLQTVTGLSAMVLLAEPERPLSEDALSAFFQKIEERTQNRPLQYIQEACLFMGLSFRVREGVLIPRPETELLVRTVLPYLAAGDLAVDMGTGSGCIAISLAMRVPKLSVLGVDISPDALAVARENAAALGASAAFYQSNLFADLPEALLGQVDVLVSNPPYIATGEIAALAADVQKEPHLALDGGLDGLFFYRKIAEDAYRFLKPGGRLFLEIGYDQGASVLALLREAGYTELSLMQDLAGLDRLISAKRSFFIQERCHTC